jgi:hypothetical protein
MCEVAVGILDSAAFPGGWASSSSTQLKNNTGLAPNGKELIYFRVAAS